MTRITIYSCTRCGLSALSLPQAVNLIELQCTGRVGVPLLLTPLISGDDGVLVLGRHQETCRLQGAEDRALATAQRARQLAGLTGLGAERIRFTEPEPGLAGPRRAVETFLSDLAKLPPIILDMATPPVNFGREGLETTLSLLRWLSLQPGLTPQGRPWLRAHNLPFAAPGGVALVTSSIPYLQILGDALLRPTALVAHLRQGLEVIEHLGRKEVGIWIGGYLHAKGAAQALAEASEIISLDGEDQRVLAEVGIPTVHLEQLLLSTPAIPTPAATVTIACDGTASQKQLIEGLGYSALDVGADPFGDTFALSPSQRLHAEARLTAAEEGGAQALLTRDTHSLMRWCMLTRQGTWRASRILPVLAHQLAWHNQQRIPLAPRTVLEQTSLWSTVEHRSEVLP